MSEQERQLLKSAITDGYWERTGYRVTWEHIGPLMDAILESPWLAAHDERVRAEAIRDALPDGVLTRGDVEAIRAEERERCAQIAVDCAEQLTAERLLAESRSEDSYRYANYSETNYAIAAAIRAIPAERQGRTHWGNCAARHRGRCNCGYPAVPAEQEDH